MRWDIVRGIHGGTLAAPENFWAELGPKSGTVLLHVAHLAGAKLYEAQCAQGDPSLEENWKPATTSTASSHILLEGLTPAHTYWFRVRAMGSGGSGLWTDPVSLIVV